MPNTFTIDGTEIEVAREWSRHSFKNFGHWVCIPCGTHILNSFLAAGEHDRRGHRTEWFCAEHNAIEIGAADDHANCLQCEHDHRVHQISIHYPTMDPDKVSHNEALHALYAIDYEFSDNPHRQADTILCTLLDALGYHDVVEAYDAIVPKWYA